MEGIVFRYVSRESLKEAIHSFLHYGSCSHNGFLLKHLNSKKRRFLELKNINYLTSDGFGAIFTEGQSIIIKPENEKVSIKTKNFNPLSFPKEHFENLF